MVTNSDSETRFITMVHSIERKRIQLSEPILAKNVISDRDLHQKRN